MPSRFHRHIGSDAPDTPEAIAFRWADNAAGLRALADTLAALGPVTRENFEAFADAVERRRLEIRHALLRDGVRA